MVVSGMVPSKHQAQIERLGQHHLLKNWNELSASQKAELCGQLEHVDWGAIEAYQSGLTDSTSEQPAAKDVITPPSHVVRLPKSKDDERLWDRCRQYGEDALRAGKVGAVLLAGGQGTRLGFPHPKGKFPIGPVSSKTLFQVFADQITAVSTRVGQKIPYLIMTSDGTHDETVAYFEEHDYLGLNRDDVFFFRQGYAPCVDAQTGKMLLADRGTLSMSPDGHGGLLAAMLNAGLFDEMRKRGVELLFLHQVDNPLAKICDPAFLGLHLDQNADVSIKVVSKTGPEEKVGVAVDLNGRTAIIEYSDLPAELANEVDSDGGLKYWAGSTAIHVFNTSFLEGVATSKSNLPWHRALKKIPHLDDKGEVIHPEKENGIKFERFLFDTLPLAKKALIVETSREDEFAPLKNRTGDFSADYVRQQLCRVSAAWLKAAGVSVPDSAIVEISPRFALSAQELAQRIEGMGPIRFEVPMYLGQDGVQSPSDEQSSAK